MRGIQGWGEGSPGGECGRERNGGHRGRRETGAALQLGCAEDSPLLLILRALLRQLLLPKLSLSAGLSGLRVLALGLMVFCVAPLHHSVCRLVMSLYLQCGSLPSPSTPIRWQAPWGTGWPVCLPCILMSSTVLGPSIHPVCLRKE